MFRSFGQYRNFFIFNYFLSLSLSLFLSLLLLLLSRSSFLLRSEDREGVSINQTRAHRHSLGDPGSIGIRISMGFRCGKRFNRTAKHSWLVAPLLHSVYNILLLLFIRQEGSSPWVVMLQSFW